MIELQNFLMEVAFTHSYYGVSVMQCSMPSEKILKLLSYGMIDYIYSTGLKKLLSLGKNGSSQLAILLSRSQSKPRYTLSLQKVMGLEEPAQHEIFLVPLQSAQYSYTYPRDIKFMDTIDFYLFLEQEKRRRFQPLWRNYNLLAEGRTIQIWGPGH